MRAACAAKRPCRVRSWGKGCAVAFQPSSTCARSAPRSRESAERRPSGSAAMASSSASRCPAMRSTVPASNSASRKMQRPAEELAGVGRWLSVRSNLATRSLPSRTARSGQLRAQRRAPPPAPARAPGRRSPGRPARARGCAPRSSSSTRRSKGSSWCSYAPSAVSRTRPSSSRQVGSPPRSRAQGQHVDEEADQPLRLRPAAPRDRACRRPRRPARRSAPAAPATAASSVMNSVVPSRRASARSASASAGPGARRRGLPPRCPAPPDAGRSTGTSSSGGAPASRSRQ